MTPRPIRITVALMLAVTAIFVFAINPARAVIPSEAVPTLAPLIKEVSPAVVNIATQGTVEVDRNPFFDDPFFRRFFGDQPHQQPRQRQTQSVGSGVIINAAKGYILTNSHVVAKADEIIVTLTDRRQLKAELIGHDAGTDVAVLKVDPEGLTALKMADSEILEVGDFVIAIGNPFGLGQSVSSGIVSALGRTGLGIESYENFIQTDASINPGNSGGALVDLHGRLVGINTAIIAPGGGNIGIGFAIPINMARQIMDQLIEFGEIERGRIGVQIQDLTPELAKEFNVDHDGGALIAQVLPESPAAKAGLSSGDVIISVNRKAVHSGSDLRNFIGLLRVGARVKLQVVRDGIELMIDLKVGAIEEARVESGSEIPKLKGAAFGPIPQNSPFFGRVKGVYVVSVVADSPAWEAGLRDEDVITSVNRKPVTDPSELMAVAAQGGGSLLLNIIRGDGSLFILIR
ncbi:MAG: Do family serine endopeptidase [Proteobacteria bacterium]|nr:Do family serine endopeptidase [Pseudomonadota bacterium]MDA1355832.1 Do family serine endopeptidase [Pseudomonadota bacterium]